MAVSLSALRVGRSLPPRKIPSAAEGIKSIEKYSDLISNRARDLLACSIVPKPTTLQPAPSPQQHKGIKQIIFINIANK
jgi:hypothetical protein